MRLKSGILSVFAVTAVIASNSSAAMASVSQPLPAPGIMGMVAGGVIAAIAISSWRK
jgi:hypothetical protein